MTKQSEWFEYTTPEDQYYNYCWWPYQPVATVENKYRPVNLLFHSFLVAGIDARAFEIVRAIQQSIGRFRTVWGAKQLGDRLAWEFYFYDYARRERDVSITRVLKAIQPLVRCDIPVNESLPYFMFSIDINSDVASGSSAMDVIHMYIGNPGSTVSSGIAYALRADSTTLENFYFFFDAGRQLDKAAAKIACSARFDATRLTMDRVLWPELRGCHTICVANKQQSDTVYFSGVNVDQLRFFLKTLDYPSAITDFVDEHRGKLDHLLYDVGFDYSTRGDQLHFHKSGFYGVL
jgi:hypothetical protein